MDSGHTYKSYFVSKFAHMPTEFAHRVEEGHIYNYETGTCKYKMRSARFCVHCIESAFDYARHIIFGDLVLLEFYLVSKGLDVPERPDFPTVTYRSRRATGWSRMYDFATAVDAHMQRLMRIYSL